MIEDVLRYVFTPASLWAHRVGHARESVSIVSRYRRCRTAWQPHLDASRAAVCDAARDLPHRRTALVLGSGHLLDLPLDELARDFACVLLVDIVHPFAARRAARRHRNVELIEWDVTGLAEAPDGSAWTPPPVTRFHDRTDIDLCVSLNLLSQLPFVPLRQLRRQDADEMAAATLARAVIRRHLDFLAGFSCCVCLVADLDRIDLARDGTERHRESALADIELPPPDREWLWEISPAPEIFRDVHRHHRVGMWRGVDLI